MVRVRVRSGERVVDRAKPSDLPLGKILAVGKKDGTTLLHDLTSKRELARYEAPHQGEVVAIAFSPDGAHLTSVYSNGTALIWRKHKK